MRSNLNSSPKDKLQRAKVSAMPVWSPCQCLSSSAARRVGTINQPLAPPPPAPVTRPPTPSLSHLAPLSHSVSSLWAAVRDVTQRCRCYDVTSDVTMRPTDGRTADRLGCRAVLLSGAVKWTARQPERWSYTQRTICLMIRYPFSCYQYVSNIDGWKRELGRLSLSFRSRYSRGHK